MTETYQGLSGTRHRDIRDIGKSTYQQYQLTLGEVPLFFFFLPMNGKLEHSGMQQVMLHSDANILSNDV